MDLKKYFRFNTKKLYGTEISHALVLPCFAWAYFTPAGELGNPAYFPMVVDEAALEFAVAAVLAMDEG